jgi:hypothetical protein
MRKITKDAIRAYEKGEEFKRDNTQVIVESVWTYLVLHGHRIAGSCIFNGDWVDTCGHKTNTTKERLNGLKGVNIHQKNFVWYLNGHEWTGQNVFLDTWNLLDKYPDRIYDYESNSLKKKDPKLDRYNRIKA